MYHCHDSLDSEQVCLPKFKSKEKLLVTPRCRMLLEFLTPPASCAPKPSPLGFQSCSKVPTVPPPHWASSFGKCDAERQRWVFAETWASCVLLIQNISIWRGLGLDSLYLRHVFFHLL